MMNLENQNIMGQCCCCGGPIPIYETTCSFCLDDMSKQSDYENYLDTVAHDYE